MNILDFIFPKNCFGCGKGDKYICSNCLSKVGLIKPFCPVCHKASIDGMTHVGCKSPLGLDGLISIYKFEGVVRKAILELKYKFVSDCADELSRITTTQLKAESLKLKDYVLVPVPLHKSRERWRGFNQSEVLGKLIAQKMNWKFQPDLLVRKIPTKSQTELKKKDRGVNVRGVFSLNPSYKLLATNYLLFDDVWTTGSTMKEACKVLKRNGVKNVWGLTICS